MTPYKHKILIQSRFKDIDNLGHINSAVYFTYFEHSRVQFFNSLFGNRNRSYWAEVSIVIAKQEMDYKQQVLLDDTIYSYVWVSRMGTKSFDMSFSLVKEENGQEVEVAKGMGVLVCINLKTNQTVPVPDMWKEKMLETNKS